MKLLYKSTAMESLRKWFYKPKRDDRSLLAQFFFADETLNMVAAELDSFDGREYPERCSTLVNQLRHAQEHVLNITNQIMDQLLGSERVARGFRVKFPEDVLQDNLAGQLWFGAECLAAGSSIMNREEESSAMRPLAKALTRSLETVRALLREHCLRCNQYGSSLISCCSEMLHESLKIFDRLFAEFELCYVSAMVPVKTPKEFEAQQLICVLFSETLQRARRVGLLTQEQIDDYDPALMFAIPRLAIISGLLIYSSGPLSIDKPTDQISDMFRPFRILLQTIKQLLLTLDKRELYLLEKLLCTNEDIANIRSSVDMHPDGRGIEGDGYPDISEFVTKFYSDNSHCKDVMMNQMVGCEWGASDASTQLHSVKTINEDVNLEEDHMLLQEEASNIPIQPTPEDNTASNIDQKPLPEMEVNLDTGEKTKEKEFHSRTDDIIRLSVQAADGEISKDITNASLTVNERRNSNSNRSISSSRKSSRNESICSNHGENLVRNLSHNGLSMFDPLAAASTSSININPTASDNNVLIPDQMLVSNLSDQVSEIADKLSHITYGELPENSLDNMRNFSIMDSSISNLLQDQLSGQIYSFSSNDVSNLGASRTSDSEFQISRTNVNYSPSRNNDKHSNMPSTSHGYLIPNAISQEPAILATLSNNNPMMEDDVYLNPMGMNQLLINIANMENDVLGHTIAGNNEDPGMNQLLINVGNRENEMISDPTSASNENGSVNQLLINIANMENENVMTDSISAANANLSSLLLTNEEFHNRFSPQTNYDATNNTLWNIDDSRTTSNNDSTLVADVNDYDLGQQAAHQRAKFVVGFETDSNEKTPGDSGICTENTSLDRTPDSEIKDINNAKNVSATNVVAQSSVDSNRMDTNCNWGHLDQNRILSKDNNTRLNNNEDKNLLDVSASQVSGDQGEISSYINYSESSVNVQKNQAGSSQTMNPEFVHGSNNETFNIPTDICTNSSDNNINKSCDINLCSNNLNLDNVDGVIQRTSSNDNVVTVSTSSTLIHIDPEPVVTPTQIQSDIQNVPTSSGVSNATSPQTVNASSPAGVLKQRKMKKSSSSSPKNKKKSSRSRGSSREFRVWSPGRFVLENNRPREHRTPLKLNLEQFVDETVEWNSSQSSATSSFHSECADDEEIALALQAQELAARQQTRAKFSSSEDLIHRLFVCIAGVADQLQTNFASDLRNILKSVFLMNQSPDEDPEKSDDPQNAEPAASTSKGNNGNSDPIEYQVSESEVMTNGDSFDSIYSAEEAYAENNSPTTRRSHQSLAGTSGGEVSSRLSSSRQNSQKSLDSRRSDTNMDNNDNVSKNLNQDDGRSNQSNSPRSTSQKNARSSSSSGSESGRHQNADCDYSNSPRSEQRTNSGSGDFAWNAGGQVICQGSSNSSVRSSGVERAPEWVPDIAAPDCMRCGIHFTAFRRRHHCRNCGKVFCASCSSNSIPLPRFGQMKPVRVCEECYQSTNRQNTNAANNDTSSASRRSNPR